MTIPKLLKILLGLFIVLAVTVGLISLKHPIILKWVAGSARHHGSSIPTRVYVNGKLNPQVKVYYTDEANTYLVSLPVHDSSEISLVNIDLNKKWIGRPVQTSKDDYDLIAGHLFQSKTATDFSPLQDDKNRVRFDPKLTSTETQIKFILPSNKFEFDSVRILLPW